MGCRSFLVLCTSIHQGTPWASCLCVCVGHELLGCRAQYEPNHWDWPTESEGEEEEEEAGGEGAEGGAVAAAARGAEGGIDGHDDEEEQAPDEDQPAG